MGKEAREEAPIEASSRVYPCSTPSAAAALGCTSRSPRARTVSHFETRSESGAPPLQDFGVAMEQVRDVGAGEHGTELEGELLGRSLRMEMPELRRSGRTLPEQGSPLLLLQGHAIADRSRAPADFGRHRGKEASARPLPKRDVIQVALAKRAQSRCAFGRGERRHHHLVRQHGANDRRPTRRVDRVSGTRSSALDMLALTLIGARIAQTLIHVSREQTNLLASVRFGFFFVQLICMFWMTGLVVQHAI